MSRKTKIAFVLIASVMMTLQYILIAAQGEGVTFLWTLVAFVISVAVFSLLVVFVQWRISNTRRLNR